MAVIAVNKFDGEVPFEEPAVIPETAAQVALDCYFRNSNLSGIKEGLLLNSFPSTNPVRSMYTEDGNLFFTWTAETYPFRGPIIDDTYQRVYFLDGTTAKVAELATATVGGGPPSSSFIVGVPTPTVAPVLSLLERTTLADYPAVTIEFSAWYDFNGTRYGEAPLSVSTVTPLQQWTFTAPAVPAGATDAAALVVRLRMVDSGKELLDISSTVGDEVPASSSALPGGVELSIANQGSGAYEVNLSWGAVETRAYVSVEVNTWGEESAPSPPALVSPTYIQDVIVQTTTPSFAGYRPRAGTNIYHTFGTNPTYLRVATQVNSPFTDSDRTPVDVTSALISTDFSPPPTGLTAFGYAANGICYAAKGNTLYFCEPYRPHAYPYSMSFAKNIRGVCAGAQSIVVTTADGCYVITGTHSAAMNQLLLPVPQAGLSTRSMVRMDGSVAFASQDGIVLVTGSQATLDFSRRYFSRETWRSRYSTLLVDGSMRLAYHDGSMVCATSNGLGFIVSTEDKGSTFSELALEADALFYAPVLDTLYYSDGPNVYAFQGAATSRSYLWQSKDFIFQSPTNFAIGYIRTTGSVTLKVYADGALHHLTVLSSTGYFRVPGGSRATRWSFSLAGSSAVVKEFYLASSVDELKNV